jgi:hypothetical protein
LPEKYAVTHGFEDPVGARVDWQYTAEVLVALEEAVHIAYEVVALLR